MSLDAVGKNLAKTVEKLRESGVKCELSVPLSAHSSFKIGGPAAVFATPACEKQLKQTLKACAESGVKRLVLGNGSNVLFSDRGFNGVIISTSALSEITITEGFLSAGGGALLSRVCTAAREHSLTGMEFAYGIPGTVGGAAVMNAGAYGGEMSGVVTAVTAVGEDGEPRRFTASELDFGYRKSVFSSRADLCITTVDMRLEKGDRQAISDMMSDLMARRVEKQPLNLPSAGSTFLRPQGHYAGALIEAAGLKGFKIGGAQVSEKHAGFIVNAGGATAEDVKALIEYTKEQVYRSSGVTLECEVKIVGF